MTFIQRFEEVCDRTETPGPFAKWAALSGLSAALGRRVWIERGDSPIFLNLFVILVDSSGGRKSAALNTLEMVFKGMTHHIPLAPSKVTAEAFIQFFKKNQEVSEGDLLGGACVGFGIYDEIVTFLNQKTCSPENGLDAAICTLYGCKDLVYTTISRGEVHLKDTWFGFIGAATHEGIRNYFTSSMISGGFCARAIFVTNTVRKAPVPFPPDQRAELGELAGLLDRLAKRKGPVDLSPEAVDFYSNRYNEDYYNHPLRSVSDLSGYLNRRGDTALKVACLLAVNEESEKIEVSHVQEAFDLLVEVEKDLPQLFGKIQASRYGIIQDDIEKFVREKGSVSQSEIQAVFRNRISGQEVRSIMSDLEDSGLVKKKTERTGGRPRTLYQALEGGKDG